MAPFKVKAVYDYTSEHDDDLNFEGGQLITVTDEEGDDWYYGEYKDQDGSTKKGLFPRNFVEIYEPVTPPRPSRPAKKDSTAPAVPAIPPEPETATAQELDSEDDEPIDEAEPEPEPEGKPILVPAEKKEERAPRPVVSPPAIKSPEVKSPEVRSPEVKSPPALPASTKPTPAREPPVDNTVSDKPAGNSFRDRIAAFNKSAAPPVAPKPSGIGGGGGSSAFIKKQYVAPPPSRNAYVPPAREPPPQKVYRREEEPTAREPAEPAAPNPPAVAEADETEEQPKPTSLKERIALLQKQQLENANKHAEAAQKKEKPKRPPKKRVESHENAENEVATAQVAEIAPGPSIDTEDDQLETESRPPRRRTKSRDSIPLPVPTGAPRELLSDTNDADQSAGAETEDGADAPRPSTKPPPPPARVFQPQNPDIEQASGGYDDGEQEQESEEDEVDAETRRRMEIRDRMAKMSGGMGMAGMFGPPGGIPLANKRSKPSADSGKKRAESNDSEGTQSYTAPPVPVMPGMALPGMHTVRSPEPADKELKVTKEREPSIAAPVVDSDADSIPDIEEVERHVPSARTTGEDRPVPAPPIPQERPVPVPPETPRAAPPVPSERPVPPPPSAEPRSPQSPPPPPVHLMSADSGSESDDERPESRNLSVDTEPISPRPPVPSTRPQGPRSPTATRVPTEITSPVSSEAPSPAIKRNSRLPPPIPGGIPMPGMPSARAPPPPPPQAPPRRSVDQERAQVSDSEEVTEYEGDYDTDIASGETHKDALRSHDRTSSTDETLTGDEAGYHHGGLPSLGPPSGVPPVPGAGAPRGAPPPPPGQPPKQSRQSSEMPRGAPPPPPPPKNQEEEEYDPYNYASPQHTTAQPDFETVVTPRAEDIYDEEDLYSRSPPREPKRPPPPSAPPQVPQSPPQIPKQAPVTLPPIVAQQPPPSLAPPPALSHAPPTPDALSPSLPRGSLDVPRTSTSRRSTDAQRPSMEGGFIADDVDIGRNSQWWLQRKMPPPAFQNRSDVWLEFEETSAERDGQTLVMKHVYALFIDYSQTVITVRFDIRDPSHADLQQRHEAPPPRLRQDQLEDAHSKFGAQIAKMADVKQNSVVGNGTPSALVWELLGSLPEALLPVGSRAYGALVYVNLANATVQQHDEIRAGDVVSFRNAKLAGHRGGLKQKYAIDIGKPDHVGVVLDWDGTKKKIRAYEQGRESKKVKVESFKLGDLKSGEVKVWRVVGRNWVGWGTRA